MNKKYSKKNEKEIFHQPKQLIVVERGVPWTYVYLVPMLILASLVYIIN